MTNKTIMQQVKEVTATANFNRNVHKELNPEDTKTINSMINDIEERKKELDDAKGVLSACLDKNTPLYT